MRTFVRFSYGIMEWQSFTKNAQVGFKFPSLRDNCKESLNAPLSSHGNLKYPLDRIVGNTGEKGVWIYQLSAQRSPIDDANGKSFSLSRFFKTRQINYNL